MQRFPVVVCGWFSDLLFLGDSKSSSTFLDSRLQVKARTDDDLMDGEEAGKARAILAAVGLLERCLLERLLALLPFLLVIASLSTMSVVGLLEFIVLTPQL